MSTSAGTADEETIPGQLSLPAPAPYLGLIPCALAEAELPGLLCHLSHPRFHLCGFAQAQGPCTESHLDGDKALHRKDWQELPAVLLGSCQELGCFDFLSREVQTPEGRNVVYCVLILFLQS